MLPQRAVHKLGRHLTGLDNWPMVASYPQESGEREFRQLVRIMEEKQAEEKKDTEVTLEKSNEQFEGLREIKLSFSNWLCKDCKQREEEIDAFDTDDVDGRTEEILKPLVKLNFLYILFIDIGISLGDVLTDLAQGINLVLDRNWNIQWTTFSYGLVVIGIVWLPVIPVFIHILSFKNYKYFS